jgi:hypothetical protein
MVEREPAPDAPLARRDAGPGLAGSGDLPTARLSAEGSAVRPSEPGPATAPETPSKTPEKG